MKRTLLSGVALFFLLAGCNGGTDADAEYFIRASVTMTDGSSFEFHEACVVSQTTVSDESTWGLEAMDPTVPFGLVFFWKEEYITGPGSHDVNEGLMDMSTMVVREHPTDPSQIRMSGVSEGTIVFEQIGYDTGDLIEGTFDDIRLDRDETDDTVHIQVVDGSFHCRIGN